MVYNRAMKKWIYRILMLICLGVFSFSAYQLWQIYSTKQEVAKETEHYKEVVVKDNSFKPDWATLQSENPDIVAWIYVPDCKISFPVVQGNDNSFYLQHTSDGSYNAMGAIFLDSGASSDFSDDHSLIYGHSVEGGGMATDLRNYSDQAFFQAHPVFYVLTPQGNYRCDVLMYSKTVDGSVFYTTSFGDYKEETLAQMKSETLYMNDIEVDAPLVSISTCDLDYGFNSDRRLVLTGVMHPTDEPIEVVD